MQSFDVFFDRHRNKRLSKQSWGCWFEMLSGPIWCHCNARLNLIYMGQAKSKHVLRYNSECEYIFYNLKKYSAKVNIRHCNRRTSIMTAKVDTPGPQFNIKMSSYQYRKSHCGDKTVVRSSYLNNGISYTGKMSSLYWIGAQNIIVYVLHDFTHPW